MNFSRDPKYTLELYKSELDKDASGMHYLFSMKRNTCRWLIKNEKIIPSPEQIDEAVQIIRECCELDLSVEEISQLLRIYPKVRIKLSTNGSHDDETREELCEMLSDFLLGCRWPMYADNIDISDFNEMLKKQGMLYGYKTSVEAQKVE